MRTQEKWDAISIKPETNDKLKQLRQNWSKHNMDEVINELLKIKEWADNVIIPIER